MVIGDQILMVRRGIRVFEVSRENQPIKELVD
jgi:hypothetical protein